MFVLKQRNGTSDALYRHWILGQNASRSSPRWWVARNVSGGLTVLNRRNRVQSNLGAAQRQLTTPTN